MTDLSIVLPAFPTDQYRHLIPSLEKNLVTTADLLTLDAVEIAKRAHLPVLDVKRLCTAVLRALQDDLGLGGNGDAPNEASAKATDRKPQLRKSGNDLVEQWSAISTLDGKIDAALGGGIPTGYITEITGESGAGKTQFLLSLLLSAQLSPPHGLQKSTLYISTESPLPTSRLSQLLSSHPHLSSLPASAKPSLDNIISIVIPDLESQDHILRFHLPVAIRRHNIGLVILDSVTAHYRAEFERPGASKHGANMAKRTTELVQLGRLLRDLARTEDVAVVVANQVADRFPSSHNAPSPLRPRTQSSPLARRGVAGALVAPASPASAPPDSQAVAPASAHRGAVLTLDHQQRFFTGWGDAAGARDLKTPSLGLVWTSQVACRVALVKRPVYGREGEGWADEEDGGVRVLRGWRRWVKVVFCAWAEGSGKGVGEGAVEFEITKGGVGSAVGKGEGEGEGGGEE